MQVESVLIRVDVQGEAERLVAEGGDLLTWTGVVPSAEGGEVTWASAVVRLPVDAAVRLGLITLGGGLREPLDAATEPAPTAPTTPPPIATTSTSTSLVAPRRHRSRSRRPRRALPWDTAAHHRPASDAPSTLATEG